jgi:PAS domain-containing protein
MRSETADRLTPDTSRGSRSAPHSATVTADRSPARMLWTPGVIAALVATLPIGVVLLSMDGSVVYANDAAWPLWTNAHTSASGAALDNIIARALLAQIVVRDQEITVDPCLPGHDRDWIHGHHLQVSATPLCRARDEMDGLLVTIEDVTARTEMERVRPMFESLARL